MKISMVKHRLLENVAVILIGDFKNIIKNRYLLASLVIFLLGECQMTSLTDDTPTKYSLGAVTQQNNIGTNFEQVLWRYMPSLGHYVLNVYRIIISSFVTQRPMTYL